MDGRSKRARKGRTEQRSGLEKEKVTVKKLRNFQGYMNVKALGNAAYIPTEVEHIANVLSHGFCVIPALAGLLHMLRLPGKNRWENEGWGSTR